MGWLRALAAWIAALIFALNPNLIYMQATAMGESLYLALFVWSAVYFSEFVRESAMSRKKQASRSRSAGSWLPQPCWCAMTAGSWRP